MVKDKKSNKLPQGWVLSTIGEVGIVTSGGTPSTKNLEFWGNEIPWVTPADLSNYNEVYISDGARRLSQEGLDYSSSKLLPKGSILFSSRAPIGYVAIAKNDLATNQGFKNLIPTKSLLSEYVYYYFKSIKTLAEKVSSGTTFLELTKSKFSQIPFPLPPAKEQFRIVSKIEELFSELDHAEEELKKAQKKLILYKQALLKNAFEGKLTKGWRITHMDSTYNWITQKIEEIGLVRGGKRLPRNALYSNIKTKYPYLRVTDFDNYSIDKIDIKYIDKEAFEKVSNYTISKNDVYISIAGTIGLSGIIPDSLDGANLTENAAKIELYSQINNKFLAYALSAPYVQLQIKNKTKATSQPKLSLYNIRSLQIDLPCYDEQVQIVLELESRLSLLEDLYSTINLGIKKAESFRYAILKKAFEGNLVYQDLKDEPAFQLLSQILLEKESYFKLQKEQLKIKSKKIRIMKAKKTVLEILKNSDEPISSKDLWQQSIHCDDIEGFYAELKKIQGRIEEIREGMESKLYLKS